MVAIGYGYLWGYMDAYKLQDYMLHVNGLCTIAIYIICA